MPFHITGLISLAMLAILKVAPFKQIIVHGFGSDTVAFFIGILALSSCMGISGLTNRFAGLLLRLTKGNTKKLIFGVLVLGMLLGMWLTTLAAAAIITLIIMPMVEKGNMQKGDVGAKALVISIAWGSLIGGIASPAGSGANPILISFASTMLDIDISFIQWMMFGIPCAIALIPPAYIILTRFYPPKETLFLSDDTQTEKTPLSKNEKSASIIFSLVILTWLFSKKISGIIGVDIPTSLPALIGACAFFLPGVSDIKWKDVEERISWSSILLIASSISLGMLLYETGAAAWLAQILFSDIKNLHPILLMIVVSISISLIKLGLSSNTVTATVVVPVLIAIAKQQGIESILLLLPCAMSMNNAYILVTSTPTSIIPYSYGYFSIADMAKPGVIITICSAVISASVLYLIMQLSGMI